MMGYGRYKVVDLRYKDDDHDYVTIRIQEPYSLPLACGSFAGSVEALVGREPGISYIEVSPGVFEATIITAENPSELSKRLRWKGFYREYRGGDIEFGEVRDLRGAGGALRLQVVL